MALMWAALAILATTFSSRVCATSKFLTAASDELSMSGPKDKSHKRKSAHNLAKKVKLPKVSEDVQSCFSPLKLGTSPGSTLGQTTEKSVDRCMHRCVELEDCYAMSYRMSDGLCNAINRTYQARFEASDERVLANKLAGCNHEYGTRKGKSAPALPELSTQVGLPEVSQEAQACFTDLAFGLSPGSTLGQSTEKNVDDCMMRCAFLEDCYAMSYQMSDGLCNAINRTYEARFQPSDERVLANKLAGCNNAYGTPKGSYKNDHVKEEDADSSGILGKIGKALGMPFKFLFNCIFGTSA